MMYKISIILVAITLLSISCSSGQKTVDISQIVLKDDSLWYFKESGKLFNGKYEVFYENNNFKEVGNIKNGILNGECIKYFENGLKEVESNLQEGKLNGVLRRWHPNGQIAYEIEYDNGNKNGKSNEWYENGQKCSEGYFLNDKFDKESKIYFESGILKGIGYYSNGELDSLYRFYKNGKRKSKILYFDGIDNSLHMKWDSFGNITRDIIVKDGEIIQE